MDPPARQIQCVAFGKHGVDDRCTGHALGDRGTMLRPRLRRQGMVVHGLVHDPALLPGRLQDEHVVDVVVRIEPAVGGWRDVGVRLHRVTQFVDRLPDEVDQRRPQPMQALAAQSLRQKRTGPSTFAEST